jgi:hypothetical protein
LTAAYELCLHVKEMQWQLSGEALLLMLRKMRQSAMAVSSYFFAYESAPILTFLLTHRFNSASYTNEVCSPRLAFTGPGPIWAGEPSLLNHPPSHDREVFIPAGPNLSATAQQVSRKQVRTRLFFNFWFFRFFAICLGGTSFLFFSFSDWGKTWLS